VNNLVVDKEKGISFAWLTNAPGGFYADGFNNYTTNDFIVNYNTFAATNTKLTSPLYVGYRDWGGNEWTNPYAFLNTTNYPAFADKANDNFELQPTDPAVNSGTNLSAYFNFDSLNRPRNVGGAWDRGPLEYQGGGSASGPTNGLLVWLRFDDNFTNGNANGMLADASGNGHNAYRFGWTNSVYPTNFPTRILSSSISGRMNLSGSDYSGLFNWHPDTNADFGLSGDYAGITNVASLTNMATATIVCWARYNPPNPGFDYLSDHNEKLLSAGTASEVPGTWEFGRTDIYDSPQRTFFCVFTNANSGPGCSFLQFPDFAQNDDTTNWNHYAVTWNNGVMIGYLNGVPVGTNDISAIVTHLQIGEDMSWKAPWISVGCDTHAGTPLIGDNEGEGYNYPNNGFLNGVLDDVRIYNTVLSPADIQTIYSSGGTGLAARPSPPTGLKIITQQILSTLFPHNEL
jgi:hypothetical protein